MDESLKVIDYIRQAAEYVETKDGSISASQMLERFLFPSSMQYTTVGKLSGGERRRLYLLRILMEAPNVLLLDEPTNDLDIQTLAILEDYLDTFPGIVITVSHDRYFLDRVVNRIFSFEGEGRIQRWEGGYTDCQIQRANRFQPAQEEGKKTEKQESSSGMNRKNWKEQAGGEKKRKLTYKEQKEWETIEDTIAGLEEKAASLEEEILKASRDYSRLQQLMQEKEETEASLEQAMDRWVYLSSLVEEIEAGKR